MTPIPEKLQSLIHTISNNKNIGSRVLCDILTDIPLTENDIAPYARTNHPLSESYGRFPVYEAKRFCIYAMTWMPGDFTAIHNHGHTEWGAVLFLGNANHRIYHLDTNCIKLTTSEIVKSGSVKPVVGKLIHAMGNLTEQPFQTLHIYGTHLGRPNGCPVEDSKVFELEHGRVSITTGPAFVNLPDKYRKEMSQAVTTDNETMADYLRIVEPYYQRVKDVVMLKRINNLI